MNAAANRKKKKNRKQNVKNSKHAMPRPVNIYCTGVLPLCCARNVSPTHTHTYVNKYMFMA